MYQPQHFREERLEVLHGLVRSHPLGAVIVSSANGFEANHIPFLINPGQGPFGRLEAHIARANPLCALAEIGVPCIVLFQGPEHYITPAWYATKRETGKVVPTWNYAVVHVHGTLRVEKDPAFLHAQITELTRTHEEKREQPWAVTDAPEEFMHAQMKGIIGITIEIARIEGKWKVSQNRPIADRNGVVEGLLKEVENGAAMSELVEARAR